jgi:hypothetical protein
MPMIGGSSDFTVTFPLTSSGDHDVDSPVVVATSGTGFAKPLLDALIPSFLTPSLQACDPAFFVSRGYETERARETAASIRKINKQLFDEGKFPKFVKDMANSIAPAIVDYIHANAVVDLAAVVATVSSQQVGRTPNPNNANTAIQAPSSPVALPVTNGGTTTIGIQ